MLLFGDGAISGAPQLSLTYLGHSAVEFHVSGLRIYVDPYFRDPIDWTKLPRGDLVIFSHGHFDHGVLMAPRLYEAWHCGFLGPTALIDWMRRKYRRKIPPDCFAAIDHKEIYRYKNLKVYATPAHHPVNRLGKTILSLFARTAAPGKPVNGYYFDGYYHGGDTVYTADIAAALKGMDVHTACLPIGGKYAVAAPREALMIAEEIGASRLVPMHWQPLVEQVFFRYQSSDLVKLAREARSKVEICPLAIGELLEPPQKSVLGRRAE